MSHGHSHHHQPGTPSHSGSHSASHEATAKRAYEIFLARGRVDGSDREDWLRAERDLAGAVRDVQHGGVAAK
jgi:hypothetical protein